jgi:hypothetical protein
MRLRLACAYFPTSVNRAPAPTRPSLLGGDWLPARWLARPGGCNFRLFGRLHEHLNLARQVKSYSVVRLQRNVRISCFCQAWLA